jgi:hypothetical protein
MHAVPAMGAAMPPQPEAAAGGGDTTHCVRLACSADVAAALRQAARLQARICLLALRRALSLTCCPRACAQELPADVRAEAARCAKSEDVPWLLLRRVCRALREAHAAAGSDASTPPPGARTPRAHA